MRSLKMTLISWCAAACVAVFALSGVALFLSMRNALLNEFDAAIASRIRTLQSVVESNGGRVQVEWEEFNAPHAANTLDQTEWISIFSRSGEELARSPSLGATHLAFHPAQPMGSARFDRLSNGSMARRVDVIITPNIEGEENEKSSASPATLVAAMAVDTREFDSALRRVATQIATVFCLATIAAVSAVSLAIARGLRPLRALAVEIAAHEPDDISRKIELQHPPAELYPVLERLNELVDKLRNTITREKAFTADVAHELRTPLAGLGTALEVSASRPRTETEYRRVIEQSLDAVRGMDRIVETLLLVARADSQQVRPAFQTIELDAMLDRAWLPLRPNAARLNLDVQWTRVPGTMLVTDPDILHIALSTIMTNAIDHNVDGGRIMITVNADANQISLRIENTGSTLAAEELSHVFAPFWRGDPARSQTGTHAGLGLSLCKKLLVPLNARVTAAAPSKGIFAIVITFAQVEQR